VEHNQIENCHLGIHASGATFGTITYNNITNCDSRVIRIYPINFGYSQPVIHYNNITNVGQSGYLMELSLLVNDHDVDATYNWWGTTDTYTIGNLIYDGNDEGNTATGVVLYTPFRLQPVPNAGIVW
jgi:hypothetical protein